MKSKIIEAIADALSKAGQSFKPALQPVPVRNTPSFRR